MSDPRCDRLYRTRVCRGAARKIDLLVIPGRFTTTENHLHLNELNGDWLLRHLRLTLLGRLARVRVLWTDKARLLGCSLLICRHPTSSKQLLNMQRLASGEWRFC